MANKSHVTEFILLGFPGLPQKFDVPISLALFLSYLISLFSNTAVLTLIIFKKQLHQPMYIIIANLALSDILFDTATLPKIIAKYWFGAASVSFAGCVIQLFCVHYLGSFDSCIIMVMAIDRYVAICNPLRYSSIITNKRTVLLCGFFWLLTSIVASVIAGLDSSLYYCDGNQIKSCFCTNMTLIALSCSDITFVKRFVFGLAMIVLLLPLCFIIFSYMIIIKVIHSRTESERWKKAFYTCSTHLFVIGLYFIPRLFVYISNQVNLILNGDVNVLLLCVYSFVPHMANPIIYCLGTKEIRRILRKLVKKKFIKKFELKPTINVISN
ncbi:olfactory receptor 56A4-like [Bombina bombina]|uniref:olfactory receptor 56A4-like n=1 Tax=Bombina bombina TaxID=8345 RepID=UPI00235A9F3A|nr:olfactory receptor 56A4-like [Bombina bombina]XP_053561608.1 olfactory receptor 56A4-like [Bombina bombina]